MPIPSNHFTEYEKILLKNIGLYSKRIQRLYNQAIVEISLSASTIKYNSDKFTLDLYPAIRSKIDKILSEMQKEMLSTINQATREAWDLSNKKNDIVTRSILGKIDIPKDLAAKFFNPNIRALEAFQRRRDNGLNLAQRIWKNIAPFKHELEAGLADGISSGRSAAEMARVMKKYLKEPDKLFRRVRDENGKLQLSKAAQAYNPGQGVYRSSYKNALRLTRTETNMSYRNADYERWLSSPFVLGIEIKLSKAHPKYDICDPLAGQYPKQFNWAGWHPQCLCFAVPVLASEDKFGQLEDEILGLKKTPTKLKYITEMPKAFKDYLKQNQKRIAGWKNKPLWMQANPQFTGGDTVQSYKKQDTLTENVGKLLFREREYGTNTLYRDVSTGKYLPSRTELHDQIISEYLRSGSTNLGTSYFMGGAPATGKSSLLETGIVKLPKGILTIDPDKIKGMLPEYNEMVKLKNSFAANKVHEESSTISKSIVENAGLKKFDIVNDGVGDGEYEKLVNKVKQQRAFGKKVVANYVTTDVEESVTRAKARAEQTGREVPETYIRSMHKEIAKLIPKLAKNQVFDELRLYNNDVPIGVKPILIFEQIGGRIIVHNKRLYEKFLSQSR